MTARTALLVAVFAAVAMTCDSARAQATTGWVEGTVRDPMGQHVVGAAIVAESPETSTNQTTMTDDAGQYVVADLPHGTYKVTAYFGDAVSSRSDVAVRINYRTRVDLVVDATCPRVELQSPANCCSGSPCAPRQESAWKEAYLRNIPVRHGPQPLPPLQFSKGTVTHRRTLELGATGIAGATAAERMYLLTAGGWYGDAWAIGATIMASTAREVDTASGTGSARLFAALAAGRRRLARGDRWSIDLELGFGVIGVASSEDRVAGEPTARDQVWMPVASLGPRLRLVLVGPFAINLGPMIDASPRAVRLTVGDAPLYHAGVLRARWDLRAQIWF